MPSKDNADALRREAFRRARADLLLADLAQPEPIPNNRADRRALDKLRRKKARLQRTQLREKKERDQRRIERQQRRFRVA